MMGETGNTNFKSQLTEPGQEDYERLVEFPLWDEYKEEIKSDIADIKNVGGKNAAAIIAGIFLQQFTRFSWIHPDIAGTAFLTSQDGYRAKNGTGVGVRLLLEFFKMTVKHYGKSI